MSLNTTVTPFNNDWILDKDVAKSQIKKLIKEWKPVLDMSNYLIKVTFYKSTYSAWCVAEPEYKKAQINFYLTKLLPKLKINYELEEFVVHEMIHCLTWESVSLTEKLIESIGDPTGVLWDKKEKDEELFVQRMSDGFVMTKYGLKTVPDAVRVSGLEKKKIKKH